MVSLSHIYKTYSPGQHVLKNLYLEIPKGQLIYLMGPSGAGKSTLFRLMTGFERPTSGQIKVNGFDLARANQRQILEYRRSIGVVFQDFKLLYDRSVFENIALPLQIMGVHQYQIIEDVEKMLEKVGLSRKRDENPIHLSGGEKQRVAIARALVHQPALIIADEPTGNLDKDLSREINRLFQAAHQGGTTIIIATHDEEIVRQAPQKKVFILDDGTLRRNGELEECGPTYRPLKEIGLNIL